MADIGGIRGIVRKEDIKHNMLMENVLKEFKEIDTGKLDDYNHPGVWAMFGYDKKSSHHSLICLNVGKTSCIKEELNVDLIRLKGIKKNTRKDYKNQFGKKIFDYPELANRLDFLYDNIKENYEGFFWIMVSEKNDYLIEKYFAYSFKAIYWVSNGKYKNEVADKEIEIIRNNIDTQKFNELKTKIDNLKNSLIKNTLD